MPGDDRPLLAPDVDQQLQQLVRLRHAFGREHLRDAQLDLHEVVDRDRRPSVARGRLSVGGCRRGAGAMLGSGGDWGAGAASGVASSDRSAICRSSSTECSIRGNSGARRAEPRARRQRPAAQRRPGRARRLTPSIRERSLGGVGHERPQQLGDDPQASAATYRAVSSSARLLPGPSRASTARASRCSGSWRRSRPRSRAARTFS